MQAKCPGASAPGPVQEAAPVAPAAAVAAATQRQAGIASSRTAVLQQPAKPPTKVTSPRQGEWGRRVGG